MVIIWEGCQCTVREEYSAGGTLQTHYRLVFKDDGKASKH